MVMMTKIMRVHDRRLSSSLANFFLFCAFHVAAANNMYTTKHKHCLVAMSIALDVVAAVVVVVDDRLCFLFQIVANCSTN